MDFTENVTYFEGVPKWAFLRGESCARQFANEIRIEDATFAFRQFFPNFHNVCRVPFFPIFRRGPRTGRKWKSQKKGAFGEYDRTAVKVSDPSFFHRFFKPTKSGTALSYRKT